jgi:hypothetical protein
VKYVHSFSENNVNVAGSVLMMMMRRRRRMIMLSLRVRLPKQPRKYIVVALNARSEHGELYKETLAFVLTVQEKIIDTSKIRGLYHVL